MATRRQAARDEATASLGSPGSACRLCLGTECVQLGIFRVRNAGRGTGESAPAETAEDAAAESDADYMLGDTGPGGGIVF